MEPEHWFKRWFVNPFINHDWPGFVLSTGIATITMCFFHGFIKTKYIASFDDIPPTALSLMGFVIAATAIVVSVQDKGMIRHYKQENKSMWNATKRIFFITARLLGLIGVIVFIVGDALLTNETQLLNQIVENAYLGTLLTFFIFAVFQLNKMLFVLSSLMDSAQNKELADKIDQRIRDEKARKQN